MAISARENLLQNPSHRWFIITAVMLSTVMEILDTTIVNVSLPHMMGSLSADRSEISWVLTSYIVASGMLMPLTGFLVGLFGTKRLLLVNIVGFMAASALCGISTNLTEIVVFRLLQGVFGASLVPLSQFILRDTFPPEEQPKVMAIWGIGIMAAPVMGPTLGGYITDALNWRWVFYINVPVCILNFFLVLKYIPQSTLRKDIIDWTGLVLMMFSVAALQLFLDRGQEDDWFSSAFITCLFIVFVFTFSLFIWHSLLSKKPIINIRLFKDRNFLFGTLTLSFFAASVLGSLTLLPQMLESLYGYTSDVAGLAMGPRGIASAIMMGVASKLMMNHYDPKKIIIAGLLIASISTICLGRVTLGANFGVFAVLGIIQGFGIGWFFMPLTTIVYTTLPKESIAEASGLFSFGRNIGNAIGISLLTTYLERNTQTNWLNMGAHFNPANPALQHWFAVQHFSSHDPVALAMLGNTLSTQANFAAFMNTFVISGAILLIAICFVLCLKSPKKIDLNNAAH
jgi:DHA2 family multidrug resistance protein